MREISVAGCCGCPFAQSADAELNPPYCEVDPGNRAVDDWTYSRKDPAPWHPDWCPLSLDGPITVELVRKS